MKKGADLLHFSVSHFSVRLVPAAETATEAIALNPTVKPGRSRSRR